MLFKTTNLTTVTSRDVQTMDPAVDRMQIRRTFLICRLTAYLLHMECCRHGLLQILFLGKKLCIFISAESHYKVMINLRGVTITRNIQGLK